MKIQSLFSKNIGYCLENSRYSLIVVFPFPDNKAHHRLLFADFSPRTLSLGAPSAQQQVNVTEFLPQILSLSKSIAFNTFVYLTLYIKYLAYRKLINYSQVKYLKYCTWAAKHKKILSPFSTKYQYSPSPC